MSIALIWLTAVAIVVPYARILKYSEDYCGETWADPEGRKYTLALFIIDYCIPLTIITFCYVRAGYVLHTKFKKFNTKQSSSAKQNLATMKRLQQNKKVIKVGHGRGEVIANTYIMITISTVIIITKGPVTRCNFSCNLQCNSTLGRCKIGKYKFPSQFANIFLTYQTFVTNLHLLRVELRCKLQEKLHRVTGP